MPGSTSRPDASAGKDKRIMIRNLILTNKKRQNNSCNLLFPRSESFHTQLTTFRVWGTRVFICLDIIPFSIKNRNVIFKNIQIIIFILVFYPNIS